MGVFDDLDPPLSTAEVRLLSHVLRRLRQLESRTRGSYAEALVCELLSGAELADHATSPFDLRWDGMTIAVRTTGSRNADHTPEQPAYRGAWTFTAVHAWESGEWSSAGKRRCWADVAVLAYHDGTDLAAGWSFHVLPAEQIDRFQATRLTPANLARAGFAAVGGDDLPSAVRAAGLTRST